MSKLTDYNPLASIELNGATLEEPRGLVVVVGPNSSGKTQFLKDIERYLVTGEPHRYVVCKRMTPRKPATFTELIDDLVALRYIIPAEPTTYRMNLPPLEVEAEIPNRNPNPNFLNQNLQKAFDSFNQAAQASNPGFFAVIGRALVHSLRIFSRIAMTSPVQKINNQTQIPGTPIHALVTNGEAQEILGKETGKVFGNAVFLDQLQFDKLYLRVTGSKNLPPYSAVTDARVIASYRDITQEGDGYKSYVSTCMTLLLGNRPVCLIDEPELCLHPPQAYALGKFIGRYAKHGNHVTFVATHSSHLLQGILESATDPKVLRLTNCKTHFAAHLVPREQLAAAMKDARVRAEAVLDGIFSRAAVIVEGDGDRAVYQAALDGLDETYKNAEIHFVPVSGTGGFWVPCQFYKSLNIPFAVIADLDYIADANQLKPIIESLPATPEQRQEILNQARDLGKELASDLCIYDAEYFKAKLRQILDTQYDFQHGEDSKLRRALSDMVEDLKRLKKLKDGGILAYQGQPKIYERLKTIADLSRSIGLFFVLRGELERWVPHLMGGVQESRKPIRAYIAANKIRDAEKKTGDVWEFMESIVNYFFPAGEESQ